MSLFNRNYPSTVKFSYKKHNYYKKTQEIIANVGKCHVGSNDLLDDSCVTSMCTSAKPHDEDMTQGVAETSEEEIIIAHESITTSWNFDSNNEAVDLFNNETELNAENQMEAFIRRIESQAAVPEYALSEEVFNVDKPVEAVCLGAELAIRTLSPEHTVGSRLLLTVTEVYSPFQFWFQEAEDAALLKEMTYQMCDLYNQYCDSYWLLPEYFMKPGNICAAYEDGVWKRARIVSEPSFNKVTVYLVDYGHCAQVPVQQVNFLHKNFIRQPAMVMRGTLTDVYPLDLHWPAESTAYFKQLVRSRDLYAIIKDTDLKDRILFVNLCERPDFQRSISDQLISAELAGVSHNYSAEMCQAHNGRRVRYIRERLPSFDMLELQLFVADSDEFEVKFDEIIYNPQFLRYFEAPKLTNPFLRDLENALADWLEKFKRIGLT